ncbi:MAG: hypothetical protein WKF84_09945 [Pyrinomonadaceae bacterium]
MLLLLIQAVADAAPPEKRPALLTLIYSGGFVLLTLLLLFSSIRQSLARRGFGGGGVASQDLPLEVRGRLSSITTNRGLRVLRWFFVALILVVFGFHFYWPATRKIPTNAFRN